jgi:hypothetical protein
MRVRKARGPVSRIQKSAMQNQNLFAINTKTYVCDFCGRVFVTEGLFAGVFLQVF